MGTFIYGVAPAVVIEDRVLKHLQAVIVAKLRRGESFTFNWDEEPGVGEDITRPDGRHGSVWVSQASQLYFAYDGPRSNGLNREWLDALMHAANSTSGLRAIPEPQKELQPEGAAA